MAHVGHELGGWGPDMRRPLLDEIIEGGCVARMATLPDGCVSLVSADPPYNLPLVALIARSDGVFLCL